MRARLEALAAKWEANGSGYHACAMKVDGTEREWMDRKGNAYDACASELRALLSEPERVRMERTAPEAVWTQSKDNPCVWVWDCWFKDQARIGGTRVAPSPSHRPVCDKDGVWWWEVQP